MAGRGSKPGERRGGRKRGTPNKVGRDIRELAQQYTAEALATLANIMRTGESEAARVSAANALLDRGHGKPAQSIHTTGEVTVHDERVDTIRQVAELFGVAVMSAAESRDRGAVVH